MKRVSLLQVCSPHRFRSHAGTLDTVKQRARWCAASSAALPLFRAGLQGNTKGSMSTMRALAAGVLGDATKVRYVALTAQNRSPP